MIVDDGIVFGRSQRAKPVIIDPGLYMNKKTDVFWVTQRRSVPTAFKLFTGDSYCLNSSPEICFLMFVNGCVNLGEFV